MSRLPPEAASGRLRRGTRASLAIQGHSGSDIRLDDSGGDITVVKSAPPGVASDRLRRQIDKQRRARAENELPYIRIPSVLGEEMLEGCYSATMEYVYFQNPVEYFNSVSTTGIAQFTEMLVGFVDATLDGSPSRLTSVDPFRAKVDEIARNLETGLRYYDYLEHLKRIDRHLDAIGSVVLPMGRCHGDLTMSNLLVAHDSTAIALVDFLDSFVESPLIDLAKIRQDTVFRWTLLMAKDSMDAVRYVQVMSHIDAEIERTYRPHSWYDANIDWMAGLNLLRIAPYAATSAVHDFLLSSLATTRIPTA